MTIYCSWIEIYNDKSYPKKPECISSEGLLNPSAESSIIRILQENNGDLNILTNNKNGSNEDITLVNHNSEVKHQWQTTFGDSMKDYGSSMSIDPQKNIYITGYTENFGALEEDLLLIKLNSNGTIEWNKTIDFGNGKGQLGLGIETYRDEAIYVTGYQWDYNFLMGEFQRLFLAKFTPAGEVDWVRFKDVPIGAGIGEDITVDSFGNAYIIGYTTVDDIVLLKYSEEGIKLWDTQWGVSGTVEWGKSLILNEDLGIITCAGYIEGEGKILLQFTTSGELIKVIQENGYPIDAVGDANLKIIEDNEGNILVPWVELDQESGIPKAYVKKYDASLEPIWTLLIPDITPQNGFAIAYNEEENLVMAVGNCGQHAVLVVIRDAEPPFEPTYNTYEIMYTNYISLMLGALILTLVFSRYSVKYLAIPGYSHVYKVYRKTTSKRRIHLSRHLFNLILTNENDFPEGSMDYYQTIFEKEHPYLWKISDKKRSMFYDWMDAEQLKVVLNATPVFGYKIRLIQKGLPILVIYRGIREWMEELSTWN